MGACNGGIAQIPEITVDDEQLNEAIKSAVNEVHEKVQENCRQFPMEIANADPQPYSVPNTTLILTKDTPGEEVAMAAILAAFASNTRDAIKVYLYIYILLY